MPQTPDWVKQLKPAGPQGSELLAAERASSNIPVDKLSVLIHGQEVLDRKKKILDVLKNDDVFDKSQNYFAGRTERMETALARAKRLRNLRVKNNWTLEEYRTANEFVGEPGPYSLHDSMFLVSLPFHTEGDRRVLTANRSLSPSKAHQSNTSSSSLKLQITKSSAAMHKPSSAMALMSEVLKPPRRGILRRSVL
jgi:hypothetical protein